MRISDWSSDVCSSDLRRGREPGGAHHACGERGRIEPGFPALLQQFGLGHGARLEPCAMHVAQQPDAATMLGGGLARDQLQGNGRAACRERVGPYVSYSGVAGPLKKQKTTTSNP